MDELTPSSESAYTTWYVSASTMEEAIANGGRVDLLKWDPNSRTILKFSLSAPHFDSALVDCQGRPYLVADPEYLIQEEHARGSCTRSQPLDCTQAVGAPLLATNSDLNVMHFGDFSQVR